jgi:hypothetical protein
MQAGSLRSPRHQTSARFGSIFWVTFEENPARSDPAKVIIAAL